MQPTDDEARRSSLHIPDPGIGSASYWEPAHLVPSAWREHAAFGFWLMSAIRPSCVVELGTHNGFSLFVFAEAAKRLGIPTQLYAIDTWAGDDQAGFYSEDVFTSVAGIATSEYPESITLIRGFFSDSVGRFDDGTIDLLHIDGRHGYDDVREDFELYRPKLSARAVVVFHDVWEFQPSFGVHRFWEEISLHRPSFEFHHGHGLGILAWGDQVAEEVTQFLSAGQVDPLPLREFYAGRGAIVSTRLEYVSRLDQLEGETENLRTELLAYGGALEAALEEVRSLSTPSPDLPGQRVHRSGHNLGRLLAPFKRLFEAGRS